MNNWLLQIKDVDAGYNGNLVLSGVNITIREHDFMGVIGPNGGGKTTFLKLILGLIKPVKGKLEYNPKATKKINIGYLPQHTQTDHSFPISVREVVLSGTQYKQGFSPIKYTEKEMASSREIMQQMGIAHIAQKPIGELSGGQQQRVLLARAVISNPELLLLDEPSTFVDSRFENELFDVLKALNKTTTIIMVSHDIGTISSLVKSIACINNTLHYHPSNEISEEMLRVYNCPIDLITHGTVPHRVLKQHKHGAHE